jgi:hypothetical protein
MEYYDWIDSMYISADHASSKAYPFSGQNCNFVTSPVTLSILNKKTMFKNICIKNYIKLNFKSYFQIERMFTENGKKNT